MTESDRRPERLAPWPQFSIVAMAALVPLGIWILAVPILGVDLEAVSGEEADAVQTIGPFLFLATASIAALAGWALLAVLKHFTSRACTGWTIVAVAALLAAMPGPFLGASNAAATAVLALMHVGIAAVLIPGLAAQPELVTAPLRPSDADSDDRLSIVERDASDRNIVRRWRHRVVRGHSP